MRKKLLVFVLMFSVLTLVPIVSVSAEKPHLIGSMTLSLLPEFDLPPSYPEGSFVTWQGTIYFEGIDEYEMRFILIGAGIPREGPTGKAGHFGEIWEIYDGSLCNMILWGYDKGVTNQKKDWTHWPYRMNGHVEGAADTAGWTEYLGRNVHMSGIITWLGQPYSPPAIAPGEFRIN